MAVEADLVSYLDTQSALVTAGTDLFEGPMPELPDACVAVTHYNSERSDEYTMGASLTAPGYEVEWVQLMVRHGTKATAKSTADTLHALLDNLQGVTINTRLYFQIDSNGPPFSLGQDANLRWRYVSNYQVRKARG